MTANSPARGEPSVEIVACASIVVRPGSTVQTTVREAWLRPTPRSRLAISPLQSRSTMQTRFSVRAGTHCSICAWHSATSWRSASSIAEGDVSWALQTASVVGLRVGLRRLRRVRTASIRRAGPAAGGGRVAFAAYTGAKST
jgi:hypothetical protein